MPKLRLHIIVKWSFFILLSKEPRKIVLGRKRLNKKVGNKRRIVLTEEEFYYIPLIKTLQAQLLSKNIINMILDGPQLSQVANTFEDFPEGSFVQE